MYRFIQLRNHFVFQGSRLCPSSMIFYPGSFTTLLQYCVSELHFHRLSNASLLFVLLSPSWLVSKQMLTFVHQFSFSKAHFFVTKDFTYVLQLLQLHRLLVQVSLRC